MTNDLDRRFLLGGLAGAAGVSALAAMTKAGPLNPPAGALVSTGKTLTDVEPRTAVNAQNTPPVGNYLFSLPTAGSYYLTGNISVPANRTAILMPEGATLDLNGFTIAGSGAASNGVEARNACTVRNGSINNVGSAVLVGVAPSLSVTVEDLRVTGFLSRGIDIGGPSVVRRCTVSGQGITAIELQGDHGVVEDCVVSNLVAGGGGAIYLNSYSIARRCHVSRCTVGIRLGFGSVADECVAVTCGHTGFQAGQRAVVQRCSAINITVGAAGNPGVGIDLTDGAEAVGCSTLSCYTGIRGSTGARIIECTADACASAAVRLTGPGNTIDSCRLNRSSTGVDMTNVGGNFVQKCVLMGNGTAFAVNVGGNWYPNVTLGATNSATNPLASVVG
ncbi:MAG: right-handed parallel beta-helix repeat-containing protein [Phycisphaerales bacterium]